MNLPHTIGKAKINETRYRGAVVYSYSLLCQLKQQHPNTTKTSHLLFLSVFECTTGFCLAKKAKSCLIQRVQIERYYKQFGGRLRKGAR
jgi:hypothetical protein